MNLDELYPWLKALHVAAVLTFTGGVLGVAVLLRALPAGDAAAAPFARAVRRWDHAVTTPAMLLTWALGLTLATNGHWFAAGWLQIKLVLVLALSGLHGVQSGRLSRIAQGRAIRPADFGLMVVACSAAMALLAVAKPSW